MIIFIAVYEYSFSLFFLRDFPPSTHQSVLPKEIHFTTRRLEHHANDVYGHGASERERRELQNSCHKVVNSFLRELDFAYKL